VDASLADGKGKGSGLIIGIILVAVVVLGAAGYFIRNKMIENSD